MEILDGNKGQDIAKQELQADTPSLSTLSLGMRRLIDSMVEDMVKADLENFGPESHGTNERTI